MSPAYKIVFFYIHTLFQHDCSQTKKILITVNEIFEYCYIYNKSMLLLLAVLLLLEKYDIVHAKNRGVGEL